MAKTNYSFAKRQRDLAKKRKKEEKLAKKREARLQATKPEEEAGAPSAEGSEDVPTEK